MFKVIHDAIQMDHRIIDDPKILNEELQKELKRVKEDLEKTADYLTGYGDLSFLVECTIDALTAHVSRYEETE